MFRTWLIDPAQMREAFESGQTPHDFAAREDLRMATMTLENSAVARFARGFGIVLLVLVAVIAVPLVVDASERARQERIEAQWQAVSMALEAGIQVQRELAPVEWTSEEEKQAYDQAMAEFKRAFERGFREGAGKSGERAFERNLAVAFAVAFGLTLAKSLWNRR